MNRFESDLTRYPPDPERNTESEEYIEGIETWLTNQMSRVRGQGHQLESVEALLAMLDDFRTSPQVLLHLAELTEARGNRGAIFSALSLTEDAMGDTQWAINKPRNAGQKRVMGIVAQWPILDEKARKIRPDEYRSWLAGRDDNGERAKAA